MEKTITLKLSGLSCGHCVASVERELKRVEGVRHAEARLEPMEARVRYDDELIGPEALVKAVVHAGYGAEL
jgi:copper chaperone CopZ